MCYGKLRMAELKFTVAMKYIMATKLVAQEQGRDSPALIPC